MLSFCKYCFMRVFTNLFQLAFRVGKDASLARFGPYTKCDNTQVMTTIHKWSHVQYITTQTPSACCCWFNYLVSISSSLVHLIFSFWNWIGWCWTSYHACLETLDLWKNGSFLVLKKLANIIKKNASLMPWWRFFKRCWKLRPIILLLYYIDQNLNLLFLASPII